MLASVAILVTLLAQYAHVLADSSSFSNDAVRVVHSPAVESLIVDTVTRRVLGAVRGDTSLEPTIRDAVRQGLSNGQVTGEIRAAAASLQSQLVSGQANVLSLTLPGIGSVVASIIESTSPQAAEAVRGVGTVTVLDVPVPHSAALAIHDLAVLGRDSSLLIVFSVAMAVLALILSADRRRTIIGLGLGAAVSGLLAVAVFYLGRALSVSQFAAPTARTAARAAWDVYLGGLQSSGLVLAGIGAAVAVVAALLPRDRSRRRPHLASV